MSLDESKAPRAARPPPPAFSLTASCPPLPVLNYFSKQRSAKGYTGIKNMIEKVTSETPTGPCNCLIRRAKQRRKLLTHAKRAGCAGRTVHGHTHVPYACVHSRARGCRQQKASITARLLCTSTSEGLPVSTRSFLSVTKTEENSVT